MQRVDRASSKRWESAEGPRPGSCCSGRDFVVPPGGLSYNDLARVEIRGVSTTQTRLIQANQTPSAETALDVSDSASGDSVVADMTIVVGQRDPLASGGGVNIGLRMGQNARVEDLAMRVAPGVNDAEGIRLEGQATVTGLDLDLGVQAINLLGIRVTGAGAVVTIEDLSLRGGVGVAGTLDATVAMRRVSATAAFECVSAFSATITVDNLVCRLELLPFSDSYALATGPAGSATDASLTVRNATVNGAATSAPMARTPPRPRRAAALCGCWTRSCAFPATRLAAAPRAPRAANLIAQRNDFDPAAPVGDDSGPGTLTNTEARMDDRASWAIRARRAAPAPRLAADRRGRPEPAGRADQDFEGDPRIVDGNGDGTARIDLGAFEYQRRSPAAARGQRVAGSGVVGSPFTFAASAVDPDGDRSRTAGASTTARAPTGRPSPTRSGRRAPTAAPPRSPTRPD